MKKILFSMLAVLSFAGFANAAALDTHTATSAAGMAIRGGSTQALATAAPTPLIKCSTGVHALVNFVGTAGASPGYTIGTRHSTGSKNFATTNSRVNIYWKQAAKVAGAVTVKSAMESEIAAQVDDLFSFGGTSAWTSY